MRLAIALLVPLALPASAQVAASADVRVGCTLPGPANSLFARPTTPRVYLPDADGMVIMEMESAGAPGNWSFETALSGYSGAGYLRWAGPNLFGTPGVDTISFTFEVDNPGAYVMRLWSQHNHPDSTLENDSWVRIDGGGWEKIYSYQNGYWNPNAVIEGPNDILQMFLGTGTHVLEFSGRSENFKMDRADIIPAATWWADPNRSESDVHRSRPVLGSTFEMQVGDPSGSAGFGAGSLALLTLGAPISGCGVPLSAYGELFVNYPIHVAPFVVPWNVVGRSAPYSTPVPNDAALLGATFMWQGALAEPGRVVFTHGLRVVLGNF
ncbi:MAG: hypothetical protein WD226_09945 [Planctomycetota bacterium]